MTMPRREEFHRPLRWRKRRRGEHPATVQMLRYFHLRSPSTELRVNTADENTATIGSGGIQETGFVGPSMRFHLEGEAPAEPNGKAREMCLGRDSPFGSGGASPSPPRADPPPEDKCFALSNTLCFRSWSFSSPPPESLRKFRLGYSPGAIAATFLLRVSSSSSEAGGELFLFFPGVRQGHLLARPFGRGPVRGGQ